MVALVDCLDVSVPTGSGNRLAIAKLADVEAVPVVILARHSQWQTVRDAVASGETTAATHTAVSKSHPDLVGLQAD